ncbi:thioredoxin family protein [Aquimarina sp. 2201CG14-23]|uniref:thioredoxin family protein n=1 Tax=Aquimarina mycalae TaxID=3040073 RepID=UPI0024782436|nr:thioredoxin family protein [Aquimarina sp. 2201CG14-23]MDH7446777.1 thioredoxin family protein [Aquimarina sp. 2201CG14-23]
MKKVVLFLLLILTTVIYSQEDELHWLTDFETAKQVSEDTKKPILMYFTGSDWCAPCIMLQEDFFYTEKFKQQSQHIVLLKVDIPRRTDIISEEQLKANKKLLGKYNKQGGFPNIIALNHKGKVLGTQGSYSSSLRDPSRYFSFVTMIIDNY